MFYAYYLILGKQEGLSQSVREKARRFELEMMEKEILWLKGKMREEAMKAYRKLILSSAHELIYFMRSE